MIHIPHKHNNKESVPSPKPTHPSHSIEEQTLNTQTYKIAKKTQIYKKRQDIGLSASSIPHHA
jgi:hypothetical protein